MPRQRGDYRVRDIADVRRFAIRIVNDVRSGRLKAADAKAIIPLLRLAFEAMKVESGSTKEKENETSIDNSESEIDYKEQLRIRLAQYEKLQPDDCE